MVRTARFLAACFAVLAFSALGLAADQEKELAQEQQADPDVTGTWIWGREENRAAGMQFTLRLTHRDGRLTGTLARRLGDKELQPVEIEEAKLEQNVLSFTVTPPNSSQPPVRYGGTVSDDTIDGVVWTLLGTRIVEREWQPKRGLEWTDVLGQWRLVIETPSGKVNEWILTVANEGDNVKATIRNEQFGEIAASNVAIKSAQLTFAVSRKANGNDFHVDCTVEPRGDALKGSMRFRENPDEVIELSGTRVNEKKVGGNGEKTGE